MFAIAFDLVVADAEQHHPKGVAQAYADIKNTLAGFGFTWVRAVCTSMPRKIWPNFSLPLLR